MKLFRWIILLCILICVLSNVTSSKKRKSKCSRLQKKYKKIKRRNKRLINKNKELLSKIKELYNKEEFTSSFLETSSDPLFKTMSRGFPLPRQTSYVGIQDGSKYQRLNYCPPGCIVKS